MDEDAFDIEEFAVLRLVVGTRQHLDVVRIGAPVDAVGGRHHPTRRNEGAAAELEPARGGHQRHLEREFAGLGLFAADDGGRYGLRRYA